MHRRMHAVRMWYLHLHLVEQLVQNTIVGARNPATLLMCLTIHSRLWYEKSLKGHPKKVLQSQAAVG